VGNPIVIVGDRKEASFMTAPGSYRTQEGAWIFPSGIVVLAVLVTAATILPKIR
jgi:hypothetical protein